MKSNDNSWIPIAVLFVGTFVALSVHACQPKNWSTNPGEWKERKGEVKSVETAVVGVRTHKKDTP